MAQQIINNGDSGLTTRNNLNSMFTEIYGAIVVPLKIPGINANTTQVIAANTYIEAISIAAANGSPTLRIGTTPNGTDIMPDTAIGASQSVSVQLYCANSTTLYFTLTGTGSPSVNVRIDTLNNYY